MLKILGLGAALIIIIATVSVGAYAYFNDITTITGNSIAAGTLVLTTSGGSTSPISATDVKPVDGSGGYAAASTTVYAFDITNGGTIAGKLDIAVGVITDNENTRSTVETNSGDTTSAANSGELGGKLKMALWMDVDKDGTWSSGDYYLDPSAPTVPVVWASGAAIPNGAFATVDSFGSTTFPKLATLGNAGDAGILRLQYLFPQSSTKNGAGYYTDNVAQSDGVAFDLTVTLTQSEGEP